MRSYEVTIREIGDDGQARVASRWTYDKGPSAGINRWNVADNLGRDRLGFAFEKGARLNIAAFLRREAEHLENPDGKPDDRKA